MPHSIVIFGCLLFTALTTLDASMWQPLPPTVRTVGNCVLNYCNSHSSSHQIDPPLPPTAPGNKRDRNVPVTPAPSPKKLSLADRIRLNAEKATQHVRGKLHHN